MESFMIREAFKMGGGGRKKRDPVRNSQPESRETQSVYLGLMEQGKGETANEYVVSLGPGIKQEWQSRNLVNYTKTTDLYTLAEGKTYGM